MERWVRSQEETPECLSAEWLFVKTSKSSEDTAEKEAPETTVANKILAACDRLVASLPLDLAGAGGLGFREKVRYDAEALAFMMRRLSPESPWLKLQTEIIGRNSCSRWHQDNYVGRVLVTYTGPGTWAVDDREVDYDQLALTRGAPTEISDPAIVPAFGKIKKTPTNAVLLMKGDAWPGITRPGLTHKSPNVPRDEHGEPVLKRLILKVDLANKRTF